jgi:5-oxoprolinase (ATP-hydrolysing)
MGRRIGAKISAAGQSIDGPALILESSSATVVEPGWRAVRADDATLILTRTVPLERGHAIGTEVDPVRLEIFNNLFMAIAEEMGVALQSTAVSVNIKERLDFSCALFDAEGALIANAPHIPVHLGSMGESIRTIIDARGGARDGRGIRRGDAYALNDPYRGGTHLPDITVIVPVFYGEERAVGVRRGARPPCRHRRDRARIDAAGQPHDRRRGRADRQCPAGRRGAFPRSRDARLLASGAHPARSPDRNISDLRAQIAACARGPRR